MDESSDEQEVVETVRKKKSPGMCADCDGEETSSAILDEQ